MPTPTVVRLAFLAGAAFFCAMAAAHFLGLKWPLPFVYWNTPFYAYQDKIISFAVTAYVALFWLASRNREAAVVAVLVLGLTVLGLAHVNGSTALASVLTEGQGTSPYWLQTGILAVYWALLTWLVLTTPKA